jgi:4-amino-4-deoxy-L-arabinose transferase-like glycosyltransferase
MKRNQILIFLLVFLAVFLPRYTALDKVVTIDEYLWVRRSANFYYALAQGDFEDTYQRWHPGVVTMWAGTAGMLQYFPAYRVTAPGQFPDDYIAFDQFVVSQGKTQLGILVAGRQVMVVGVTGVLILCYLLAKELVGNLSAAVGVLFIAFDPYHLGHSRLLHIEGALSVIFLLSIFLILVYYKKGSVWYLVASGAVAGLACLSKSTGIIMFPFTGLVLLLGWVVPWWRGGRERKEVIQDFSKKVVGLFLIWLFALALVYFLLWPAMWVKPGEVLNNVYGAALGFATEGQAIDTMAFEESSFGFDAGGYLKSLIWRSTPLTWFALLLGSVAVVANRQKITSLQGWVTAATVLVFALVFLVMMSIAAYGGKRAPHYILSIFVALDFIAGIGLVWFIGWLQARVRWQYFNLTVLAVFVVLQGLNAASVFPYYFNYFNQALGGSAKGVAAVGVGYGEALDQAAAYLAQKPGAEDTTVMSWYAQGSFSYFYPGETLNLWPGGGWSKPKVERLEKADYLVIYYALQSRRNDPATLMEILRSVEPEHIIWVNGVEYIHIYKVSDLPEAVYIPDS